MPVVEYKCNKCFAHFEWLLSSMAPSATCVNCASNDVSRLTSTVFYANKTFCPHDKLLDTEKLKGELGKIMVDRSQSCGGCGTDGSPGKCKSGSGGCGGGCSCAKKKTEVI